MVGEASHPGPALVVGDYFPEAGANIPDSNTSMFQTGSRSPTGLEFAATQPDSVRGSAGEDLFMEDLFGDDTGSTSDADMDVTQVIPPIIDLDPVAPFIPEPPPRPPVVRAPPLINTDFVAPPVTVLPPPPPDVFGNGRVLRCPFCPRYSTEGQTRGLIRHLNCKHGGATIEPHARTVLEALEHWNEAFVATLTVKLCGRWHRRVVRIVVSAWLYEG